MAVLRIRNNVGTFNVEPEVSHPLVGHVESDVLLQFPKFDTINRTTVLTKAGTIA